jgi:hypothetical protein
MATEPQQQESPAAAGSADTEMLAPYVLPAGLAWAVVVAIAGGLISGVLIMKFGRLGNLALMAIGVLGGVVSRKISRKAVPLFGWALVAATFLAMVLAQVYWIKHEPAWHVDTWMEAFVAWPKMFSKSQTPMFLGLICAGFGAYSAYWRAGKRFRRVIVMEE